MHVIHAALKNSVMPNSIGQEQELKFLAADSSVTVANDHEEFKTKYQMMDDWMYTIYVHVISAIHQLGHYLILYKNQSF